MPGARSHTELIAWQLAHTLKLEIYELIASEHLARHRDLCDQLERAASNAPRNIAEGFGRYLPGDFIRYLRFANGEFKELLDALQDARDRRCLDGDELLRLQRLCRRASKATTNFIKYLRTAKAPNEPLRPRQRESGRDRRPAVRPSTGTRPAVPRKERTEPTEHTEQTEPPEPSRTNRTRPLEPPEPSEP